MQRYDAVIIGGATSGLYFARKMALKGYSVKVIEKLPEEKAGTRMDIFHVTHSDFKKFDMPLVKEGDPAWAFEFTDNHFSSPSNKYSVYTKAETVGLHMREYVSLMASLAAEAGAEIEYGAAFKEFIFTDGAISGIRYKQGRKTVELGAGVVVDCSGSAAAARCALPNGYGVENFKLKSDDLFYVLLRYAEFDSEQINTFWLHTKSWYAPFSMNECEKIIGTGATGGYDRAESEAARLDKTTSGGNFKLVRTEKGTTPYRRPPYSLVADNFIVAGDAACLTKPESGEGVTSSMVMLDIAADVLDSAFKKGDTSARSLWEINTRYNKEQGADFSLVRAFLTKLANNITDDEIEYCFKNELVFNETFLNGGEVKAADIVSTVASCIGGVSHKNISKKTVGAVLSGAKLGLELKAHYLNFPSSPDGLAPWAQKADKLWAKVGKVK